MQFPDEVMTHCNVPSWVERSWKISLIGTPRARAILLQGMGTRFQVAILDARKVRGRQAGEIA